MDRFIDASQKGDVQAMSELLPQALLDAGADIEMEDESGATALHAACFNGQEETAALLVDAGADVNKARNDGATPYGAGRGNAVIAKLLIDDLTTAAWRVDVETMKQFEGVDVNQPDGDDWTALQCAACKGHLEAAQWLVDVAGAEIERALQNGSTPLYSACMSGENEVALFLIDKGADVNKARDNGATPLYVGALFEHDAVVKTLIAADADVNKANNNGKTPLHVSLYVGREAMVKRLVDAGADFFVTATNSGNTPLQDAEILEHAAIAVLLRDAERRALAAADFYRAALLAHAISRRTPLLCLVEALCDEPTLARLTEAERPRLFSLSRSAPSFRAARAPLLASFNNRCASMHWLRASNPFATAALYSSSLLVFRTLRRAPFDALSLQRIAEALARADCALLYQLDERERTRLFSVVRVTHAVRIQRSPQLAVLDGWRARMDWLREMTTGYDKDDFETIGPVQR